MNLRYLTPKEAAETWGISQRRVHALCLEGRLPGAERHGWIWLIPETVEKPSDARVKSGRYIKPRQGSPLDKEMPIMADAAIYAACGSPVAPGINDRLIHRPRLIEKLCPLGSRLTYIHADAGYGKTTLLMQYAKGRDDIVWLFLDDRDNDIVFFLRHLEASLRARLVELEFHATDQIPFSGSQAFVPHVLSALLRTIGRSRLTVIIDDLHIITNEDLVELLTAWVKDCPPNLTLIMASRHGLWSSLYRLKMTGTIAELTREDLCFSREETERLWGFFDAGAYSATEGWTLAVRSYGLAVEDNGGLSVSTPGADRDLCRYLLEQILAALPGDTQRFLKATSWLPDLDPGRCNSLLGIVDAQTVLDELVHRNIFTVRVSDLSYRYHTLFRHFLQQHDDGLGQVTLRKAMTSCFDVGDYEQAADYALLLDDGTVIQECIAANLGRPYDGHRRWNARKYFDYLDEHQAVLTPRVQLAKGIYLSDRGDFYEADKYLSAAISQLDRDDRRLYLQAMTHKARVLRNRASFEESTRCVDGLLPVLEGAPMQDWYEVIIEKIHNLTLTSQLAEALELTQRMMDACLISGDVRVKAWFGRYLTAIYFYMGDYRGSLRAYEQSLSIPQLERDWLMRHCVGAYAAKSYQMMGQEEKVLPLLESELERMRRLGLHEEYSVNYLLYAEVLHTSESLQFYLDRPDRPADPAASDRYLGLAEEYAILNRSTRDHANSVRIWKACADLLKQPEKAEEYITEILTLMDDTTPFFQALAYGRMANALQVLDQDRRRCIEYYQRTIAIGDRVGCQGYATVAYGRLAAIYLQEGNEDWARECTHRFLELSRQYGQLYYFRFRPLFAPVLKRAVEWGIAPEFAREMLTYGGYTTERVYINTLGGFYVAPSHDKGNPVRIRTRKARELLAYLLENRQGVSRHRICADLWEGSEANVASLFHTRRGEIRRAFASMGASNPIVHDQGVYRLTMDEITSDYDAFWKAVEKYQQEPSPQNAQEVVSSYAGGYLGDLDALWAESTRLRCEDSFLRAAETLLRFYRASNRQAEAMELLRRCTALNHYGHRFDKITDAARESD